MGDFINQAREILLGLKTQSNISICSKFTVMPVLNSIHLMYYKKGHKLQNTPDVILTMLRIVRDQNDNSD